MKHSLKVTLWLILFFVLSQVIGLSVINEYIDIEQTAATGETVLVEEAYNVSGIEPPHVENESFSFIYILTAVLIGTILVLLIIRFKKVSLWRFWFLLSVIICLHMAFVRFIYKFIKAYFPSILSFYIPITLAIVLTLSIYKVYKGNIYVHNFTELFLYGGLAAIIINILNFTSVIILLILISIYDIYAVWKSKHMVEMAKFQTSNRMFAGLMMPYKAVSSNDQEAEPKKKRVHIKQVSARSEKKSDIETEKDEKVRTAILGGGDIAFPLLFAGVVLKTSANFLYAYMVVITTAVAILLLLTYGKKGRYYPAMPFVTGGCFVGYAIILIIQAIII